MRHAVQKHMMDGAMAVVVVAAENATANGVAFKLGYVEPMFAAYLAEDWIGWALAYVTLTMPVLVVIVAVISKVFYSRDLVFLIAGYVVSELCNLLLKYLINLPRPPCSPLDSLGFPSSHAQGAFYFALSLTFAMRPWWGLDSRKWRFHTFWLYFWTAIVWIWAPLVAYSRVYLCYHTVLQVSVGAILGLVFAFLWWMLWWFAFAHSGIPFQPKTLMCCNPFGQCYVNYR